jgi:hypothetical protein
MNQKQNNEIATFIWRVISTHTIAYFVAGIFAVFFMHYKDQFAADIMSSIMRPFDSPWVALGAGLQIFRGIIIAFVLLPFKEILISRSGWIKLSGLILGLSYISTIGPTFGSFEGYIFTKIPLQYHLLGIPEALIYVFLFSISFYLWYKKPNKAWNIISTIFIILIVLMSFLGYLSSIGLIKQ